MNIKILILFLVIYGKSVFAQEFIGIPIATYSTSLLDSKFKTYQLLQLDINGIRTALNTRSSVSHLKINSKGVKWDLTLTAFNIFKNDFYVSIGWENKIIQSKGIPDIKTYKVIPNSSQPGLSCLTIADGFIYGFIEMDGIRTFIEPLRYYIPEASYDEFIVYNEKDVVPITGLKCGSEEIFQTKILKEQNNIIQEMNVKVSCIIVDIAIACDKTIYDYQGSVANSEAFVIGVLNNVQTNYDDEFNIVVEFSVSTIFVATTSSSDPWNGINNIEEHLVMHQNWANGGGYGGASYAVATAWTKKYSGGTIGLANVQSLCGSFRYNVCSDIGGSGGLLRCLQAHELGHNFSAEHDGGGSGFIMAPSLSNSNIWSMASKNKIIPYINSIGCVGICSGGLPPIADFIGSPKLACPNGAVSYTDLSIGSPNMWLWTFPGGTPTSTTQQNPVIQYKNSGKYDVTLKVTSPFGTNAVTLSQYIEVAPLLVNSFSFVIKGRELTTINNCRNADAYVWKFGDGSSSIDEKPFHTYTRDGTFIIELCATNICTTVCKKMSIYVST
ncbi:MAG: PKD domain-containing protein, partial [Saprospiraceae bacterium]